MKSPYLANPLRLADVIAAIQAMAIYRRYKLDFAGWADRISGDPAEAEHWRTIFEQHPEFFRMDSERKKASLVWRRQLRRQYSLDTGIDISREEVARLTDAEKERISRMPLTSSEVAILVDAAIKLHSTALEHKRDRRWWIPTMASLAGIIIGAVLGSLLGAPNAQRREDEVHVGPTVTLPATPTP